MGDPDQGAVGVERSRLGVGVTILVGLGVCALLAAGALLAWRAGAPPGEPGDPASAVRLLVVAYILFYGLGAVVLTVVGDGAERGAIVVGAGLVVFGTGAWLAARRGGPPLAMASEIVVGRVRPVAVLVLAGLGIAAVALLAIQFGIPLLSGDAQASRAGYSGIAFDVFRWLVPPAAVAAVGVALATGRSRDRWIAILAVGALGSFEILLASRALPFELALAVLLVIRWSGRRPSRAGWVALVGAAVVLFLGVQLARLGPAAGFSGLLDAASFSVNWAAERLLLIHPKTIDIVVTVIPSEEPYFAGSTYVRPLAAALGREPEPILGYWIYARLFPGSPGGFAAPGLLGEAWANGGPLLAAGLMFLLGYGTQALWRRLVLLPSGAVDRAFVAALVVAVTRTYATSLNGFLLTAGVTFGWWVLATGRGMKLLGWLASRMRRSRPDSPGAAA